MSDGGKGSNPRPFSVSQEEFANNFDRIFRKNKDDQRRQEADVPKCGCGRSKDPNGYCDGSHSRSTSGQ